MTPRFDSHMRANATKRARSSGRSHAEKYTVTAYERAITRAIVRANRERIEAACDLELHIPHWRPNQLRHTHGTLVRHRFGLEAAQVALGHERADVTQIYAERNTALGTRIALEMG